MQNVNKTRKCPNCLGVGQCEDGSLCSVCMGTGEVPTREEVLLPMVPCWSYGQIS